MQQYFEIKSQYQDTLLFFQVGDFFELFFDDAIAAAAFLNITLTKRGTHQEKPIPLCGVPSQSLEVYLSKLVKGGFKVAICEQLEEAVPGKVVKRGITRVLTPGTLIDSNLLDDKSASYFCSFFPLENSWGILFGELLTAQLFATVLPAQAFRVLESELVRFLPDEILLPSGEAHTKIQNFFKALGYVTTIQEQVDGINHGDQDWIAQQFRPEILARLKSEPVLYGAIANFGKYLAKCQPKALDQFSEIKFYEPENFLILDAATQNHLELVRNSYDGSRKHSLLELIDRSATSMGSRLLKKWLMRPLIDKALILQRQAAIFTLHEQILVRNKLASGLKIVGDLERVIGRIALDRANLGDYLQLKTALLALPEIKIELQKICLTSDLLKNITQNIFDFSSLTSLLEQALNDDSTKDWLIKSSFNTDLAQIRNLILEASLKFVELEEREQKITGINSLKVRFNQVHGYYIEITKANLAQVPAHYIRQQTLVGKERYMTHELQQLQANLEQARQNIDSLEQALFLEVKKLVANQLAALRKLVVSLANLDALLGLAQMGYDCGYVLPEINDQLEIKITQGRHPVVEQFLHQRFIPNDTNLTNESALWIITGPNMGGKSTYLRQVALICVLAQIGSLVPAQGASLPILDRIFTRIGAGDQLSRGKSTFLVEMEETANICRQATSSSLVILDEVGRGTSTFDGLAIAQAVIEYLYTKVGAKCLFATHYHELTTLADQFAGIANYYAASEAKVNGIILLHRIEPGVASGSFGIGAAQCANLPEWIIQRAQSLLQDLNRSSVKHNLNYDLNLAHKNDLLEQQVAQLRDLASKISSLDLDNMTPRQAFDLLHDLKQKVS